MNFCNLRCLHDDPLLTIDNNVIPVVKEAKFLGILFDNKLSFIPHLRNLRAKCMKALNLLRVESLLHRDWGRRLSHLDQIVPMFHPAQSLTMVALCLGQRGNQEIVQSDARS